MTEETEMVFMYELPRSDKDEFEEWMSTIIQQFKLHAGMWAERPRLPNFVDRHGQYFVDRYDQFDPYGIFTKRLLAAGLSREDRDGKQYWTYCPEMKRKGLFRKNENNHKTN